MSEIFGFIDITIAQADHSREITQLCDNLFFKLETYAKEGRYLSICKSKLEEFAMFANKAISRDSKIND